MKALGMRTDEIAALLRIKRARELQAEMALRRAEGASLRARKMRHRAEEAKARQAAQLPAQEAAIYRALADGPIPARRLWQAMSELSALAAYSRLLAERAAQAERHEARCATALAARRRAQAEANGEVLGAEAIQHRLETEGHARVERFLEGEIEEIATLRGNFPAGRKDR